MVINKLKYGKIKNDKILLFLSGLAIIGLITGSLFITILSSTDKTLVEEYITNFVSNLNTINFFDTFKNSILSNIVFFIIVSLLGFSIIGVPIIIFLYFLKFFSLGFSISSFILSYKLKGILISFIYIFPLQIFHLLVDTLLCLYSIKISCNFIYSIFQKKDINYHKIIKKYIFILFCTLIGYIISSLYESFVLPFLLNKIINIIK